MPFTGILPPLLFGLVFAIIAVWLFRNGYLGMSFVPAFTALLLLAVTLMVYLEDRGHVQAIHDVDLLLNELGAGDLYGSGDLRDEEETLFLFSTASLALFRALEYAPDRGAEIDSTLQRMARWVSRKNNLPQWRSGSDWDREVFFLAHAGAVLGHYQLASTDERYSALFARIGRHLGQRLHRGHYKHLGSHPNENLLRPADNAAAIYTLTLYDRYYGEQSAGVTRAEWTGYIDRELYYMESRLPCAAFTITNRCALEPSAAATGLYIAYRAAGESGGVDSDIPYREWLHYFKRFSGNPFGLSIRPNMRQGQVARLCNTGLSPLSCGIYEQSIGLWAAAEYNGGYTYFRLFCGRVFARWFGETIDYGTLRPARRVKALTDLAINAVAEGTPDRG